MSGKGDSPRQVKGDVYRDNYDAIFRKPVVPNYFELRKNMELSILRVVHSFNCRTESKELMYFCDLEEINIKILRLDCNTKWTATHLFKRKDLFEEYLHGDEHFTKFLTASLNTAEKWGYYV